MSAATQLAIVARPTAPTDKWISAEEVMRRTGWSSRTFFRRSNTLISRSSDRAANGRPRREYLASSLPQEAAEPQQQKLAVVAPPASALGPLFAGLPAVGEERIVLADPDAQKQAQERYDILKPVLEYPDNPDRYAQLHLSDGRAITSQKRMIEYAAEISGRKPRALQYWLSAYRSGGFAALADRIRADKGRSRWFERHQDAKIFAAYLYLIERQSVSNVVSQLAAESDLLGLSGADLPSHETVRVFLTQNISPAMTVLARQGERAYRERMAPYVRRGYTDIYANQVWVGDHAIIDREIQNDLFDEVPFGTPGRLRMSAFVDFRSRKAWGTWAWEGSSRSIAATMLRAMLEVGPPEHIYVDNGKDYKKIAKGARRGCEADEILDDEKAPSGWWQTEYDSLARLGFLARLGISVTHCIPRHPQSKHVERFFRTMHMHLDALGETYTSGSPFTRPDATEKAMMRHRRLLKAGRVADSKYPTASRYILDALLWLDEYNNTPQRGEGMDGRTPNEVFAENRNPNQKPVPDSGTLAMLMHEFERRRVHECAIRLKNYRYTPRPEDRQAWAAMHEANETEVLVGYNPEDPEYAAVLTPDGQLIAWLEAEPLLRFAPNDPETQAQIGQSMAIRRGMEKAAKQSLALIASTARSKGAQSPEEILRRKEEALLSAPDSIVLTQRKPHLRPNTPATAPVTPAQAARLFREGLKK